ncbi:helix-hairpin-helix domain-containing protein, partial [Nocardioides marinus]
ARPAPSGLDDLLEPVHSVEPVRVARTVPMPGRHASRRPTRLPGPPAHLRLGLVHLAVVAVVVALGLAVTSWWVVRSEPVPVSAPLPAVAPEPAGGDSLVDLPSSASGEAAPAEETSVVVVDVAGRVRRPGVLELPVGSRVVDAIEAAGGARGGVDLSGLNLARVLVDGEQVLVGPGAAAVGVPGAAGAPAAPGAPAALVDLNTADQALLESLPEVGPVTAQAILAWREEHGGFTAVQELLEVDGIGPATLETLAPLVTV